MIDKLLTSIRCWALGHDWTSKAQEDIPPTKEQLKGGVDGFQDYAQMYCSRCGHVHHTERW